MQKRTNPDITIKDVANRAGVAVSTVSRVINNLDNVSPLTRKKVLSAIEELGYVHNSFAAAMKTGKTKMIVVVVPDLINSFFPAIVQGVEEVFNKKGYYTLVFTTNEAPSKEEELFSGVFGKMVDGAILVPSVEDAQFYTDLKIPLVLVDRTLGKLNTVVINNYKGGYLATKELLSHGHRRIAVLNGDRDRDFTIGSNRYDGYLAAMGEAGVPVRDEYVQFCRWDKESGYEKTSRLFELECPPTAIYATNSQICIGCLNYLRDHDLKVGRDVSLVSFDDTLEAQLNMPPVTVISRPMIEMGRVAAEMLLNILEGKEDPRGRTMMDVRLIRRESVWDIDEADP